MPSRTIEDCAADARKYKHPSDWRKHSPTIHAYAKLHGWTKDPRVCGHFTPKPRPKGYTKYTVEEVVSSALRYPTRVEWLVNERKLYAAGQRYGVLSDPRIVEHFGN